MRIPYFEIVCRGDAQTIVTLCEKNNNIRIVGAQLGKKLKSGKRNVTAQLCIFEPYPVVCSSLASTTTIKAWKVRALNRKDDYPVLLGIHHLSNALLTQLRVTVAGDSALDDATNSVGGSLHD